MTRLCLTPLLQACNEAAAQQKDMPCLRHEFPWLLDVTQRLNANVAALHRAICLFMGQVGHSTLHLHVWAAWGTSCILPMDAYSDSVSAAAAVRIPAAAACAHYRVAGIR